jgi:hypothetical protein
VQLALGNRVVDARQVHVFVEQLAQRRVVDQRHRHLGTQPQQAVADKAAGLANDPGPVAAHYLITAKVAPERREALDRRRKVRGATGQADGIDGPR